MSLGLLMIVSIGIGLRGFVWGFPLYHFLSGRVYMGTSLAAPLVAFWVEKQRDRASPPS